MQFSTYYGGENIDYGYSMVVDNLGTLYVTGRTGSRNFPVKNAYQRIIKGGSDDAFVIKVVIPNNANPEQNTGKIEYNILVSGLVLVLTVIIIYILYKFLKYLRIKRNMIDRNKLTFKKFLLEKRTKDTNPELLSERVFELLEEIERENKVKK